jgi:hypothetical protein
MALGSPFVVRIEQSEGSFGATMNVIRSWLDHRKIEPASFKSVVEADSGVGFEIAFNSENEARLFEQAFRAEPKPIRLPAPARPRSVGGPAPKRAQAPRARRLVAGRLYAFPCVYGIA